MDEFSDLDFVVICRDEHRPALLREAADLPARLGPLLASFTGEHVGEPWLLIALYGPPLLHVGLKFVADSDLDQRVEDGRVLWQCDGALEMALRRVAPAWPSPNPQWIEDRFWIWIHYGATKVGRGELFECLEALAFLRSVVFGPLIARARGHRASGVRRLEQLAPDLVDALAATIGDHSPRGCAWRSTCTASFATTKVCCGAAPRRRPAWTTSPRSRRGSRPRTAALPAAERAPGACCRG